MNDENKDDYSLINYFPNVYILSLLCLLNPPYFTRTDDVEPSSTSLSLSRNSSIASEVG